MEKLFSDCAKWLTFDSNLQSVSVWREFTLDTPVPAEIDICGLGWFELYLNGARVSEDCFVPAWSDYRKRDFSTLLYPTSDEMTHRTYYLRYDLTALLRPGKNVLCVLLGNGWYRQTRRVVEGRNHYGEGLLLRFELRAAGRILLASDENSMYSDNFILENNLFYGETQDLSRFDPDFAEQIPANARPCLLSPGFETELCLQSCPGDRAIREVACSEVSRRGNRRIFRAEETVSGWAILRACGGDVRVRYADGLTEDGELDFSYTGGDGQIAEDIFLNPRPGQILEPRFCWHAFTYFEIEGNCEPQGVRVVHAHVIPAVDFECDNDVLNWLFSAFMRTQQNNMHCGVPSDCPHRERLGYTGDGQLTCETAMLFLDAETFYRKWIRDILDCQDTVSGHVQHTAPFYGGGGGPGGWGCAIVLVPLRHYERYGDKSILAESLPHMEKWVDSMESFSQDGLVVREYAGGWCLGEWCTPDPLALPEPFVNTYYYIKSLSAMERVCEILGKTSFRYKTIREGCERAFRRAFFRESDGSFLDSLQGADAFGIDLGLGDARTERLLKEKYGASPRFDTGIFGTDVLCDVLSEMGETEILFRLLSGREFPSFGFMKDSGATTLWEDWDGHNSRNHPMFGACAKHLVTTFAGIDLCNPDLVRISPALVPGLSRLKCEVRNARGRVSVEYVKSGETFLFSLYSDQEAEFVWNGEKTHFKGTLKI